MIFSISVVAVAWCWGLRWDHLGCGAIQPCSIHLWQGGWKRDERCFSPACKLHGCFSLQKKNEAIKLEQKQTPFISAPNNVNGCLFNSKALPKKALLWDQLSSPVSPAQITPGSCKAVATGRSPWRHQQPLHRVEGCAPSVLHKPSVGTPRCRHCCSRQELLLKLAAASKESDDQLHFIFILWAFIFTLIKEQLPLISLLNPRPGMASSPASWMLSLTGQWGSNASYYPHGNYVWHQLWVCFAACLIFAVAVGAQKSEKNSAVTQLIISHQRHTEGCSGLRWH